MLSLSHRTHLPGCTQYSYDRTTLLMNNYVVNLSLAFLPSLRLLAARLVELHDRRRVRSESHSAINPCIDAFSGWLSHPAQDVQRVPLLRLHNCPINGVICASTLAVVHFD